jgi:hypothetical protein
VLDEIITSGCIPDYKSHQYYPTPESLATIAVELANIGPAHSCLEPSAGTGGLAKFMPVDRTRCVEVSAMHANILSAQGFAVACDDFLVWSGLPGHPLFDRVVMNPPFSEGRWNAHVESAAAMVRAGGRLVAILPTSAKNRDMMPGWHVQWHGPFDNEFSGTSVSVVMMVADKPA